MDRRGFMKVVLAGAAAIGLRASSLPFAKGVEGDSMKEGSISHGNRKRVVLDGVPRVGFYFDMQEHADSKMRCPGDVCFPSCPTEAS